MFLAQVPLNTNGMASFTAAPLSGGGHAFTASYASDTVFASSSGTLVGTAPQVTAALLSDGTVQLTFTNGVGAPFTVLGTTDLFLPLSNWSELGPATEIAPGQFQFTDPDATHITQRFYRVRSP